MSNLLINESPLMVLPSLAIKIGLNEAMFLQQLHYLIGISRNERDGRKWVYNSYQEWEQIYPFWSQATIKRIVSSLKSSGLIFVTHEYNRMKIDKTNWFSINYDELDRVSHPSDQIATSQNDTSRVSNCNYPSGQIDTISLGQIDTTNNHESKTTIHKTTTLDVKANKSHDKFNAKQYLSENFVSEDLINDFILHRKNKRALITKRVIDQIISQSAIAGYSLEQAIETLIERGWNTFKADWVKDKIVAGGYNPNKQEALEQRNQAVLERYLAKYGD